MSLVLNKSNDSGILNCAFLDLKVSVVDKKFQIQVYNKTDDYNFNVIVFPFLESNIVTDICYSVFFGEILRYLRIGNITICKKQFRVPFQVFFYFIL